MKFFVDNNLSPKLSKKLNEEGFDSIHAKDINFQKASDEDIFRRASEEERIIVSADTDFGFILSRWNKSLPSIVLFRHFSTVPELQFQYIITTIEKFKDDLNKGSLIIIEPTRTRIKNLPF